MNSACLLVLLTLFVGWVASFSWDIVVGEEKRLQFYNNGTLTHTEDIPSANQIYSLSYDPVYYRVLFVDYYYAKHQIFSFDLSTRIIKPLAMIKSGYHLKVAYDPVTQLLFWNERWSIYSFSLNPANSNKAVDGNILVTLDNFCQDINVESCGGYIYWITDYEIERARFDGSEREVLIDSGTVVLHRRNSLAINQQTQKIYWIEKYYGLPVYIERADFNGQNRVTIYIVKNETEAGSLTISNDSIYWHGSNQNAIWQLPKNNPQQLEGKIIAVTNRFYWMFQVIAAKYTIKDQLKGNQNCEAPKSLVPNEFEPDCKDKMLCVHGTAVSGESRCECTQGYTGERCDIFVCQNYCLQGNCSVNAEGQPKCSCKTGYSGERCEVYACYKHCLNNGVCSLNEEDAPVCQCTADFEGEICDVSICKDYCLNGNCSVSTEGPPNCSCKAGYSGERCEVNACHGYCLNSGICSLNEEHHPVCQCTAGYDGERCAVPAVVIKCIQTVSMLRDILNADIPPVTMSKGVQSTCTSTVV